MKRIIVIAAVCCLLMAAFCGAQAAGDQSYYGQHGTAKFIGGRTVVVSIFADDATTSWDFPLSGERQKLYFTIRDRMGIGLEWLEEQTRRYGVKSEFIWDFDKYDAADGLCHFAQFDEDLIRDGWDGYLAVWNYIRDNIDTPWLLSHYNADNIVYAVHLNAPDSDEYRSFTFCANDTDVADNQIYFEVPVFVPFGHGRENTPAVYAHEILHCFGAVDLYYASDAVPQAYVDHLESTRAFDLMNRCYFSDYDRVTTAFSDVDAYFVGLLDDCGDARKYGLGPNIFQKWGDLAG